MRHARSVAVLLLGCTCLAACREEVLLVPPGESLGTGGDDFDAAEAGGPDAGGPDAGYVGDAGDEPETCPATVNGRATLLAARPAMGTIVTDGTYVYAAPWDDVDPVERIAVADGAVLALQPVGAYSIAIDETNVYSVGYPGTPTGDLVVSCPKTGCGASYKVLASGQNDLAGVAVDGANVYFTNQQPSVTVGKAPLAGGAVTPLVTTGNGYSIAVAGEQLVYAATGPSGSGVLYSLPVDGGTPTVLFTPEGGGSIAALAVDGSNVYFSTTNGLVAQMPLGGGAVTELALGQGSAQSIAVDAQHVYWMSGSVADEGFVLSAPIGGGPVTTVACGYGPIIGVAVDSANVYFTAGAAGGNAALYKQAK